MYEVRKVTDGSVCGLVVVVVWFLRKIRPTQLCFELSWVVAKKVGNNNGQLRIATPPRLAHAKPPGPKL